MKQISRPTEKAACCLFDIDDRSQSASKYLASETEKRNWQQPGVLQTLTKLYTCVLANTELLTAMYVEYMGEDS